MATTEKDPQEMLRQEILMDAGRQAERLTRRARQEAESIIEQAQREAAQHRAQMIAQAREAAARKNTLQLARIAVEKVRMRAARIESLLNALRDDAAVQISPSRTTLSRELLLKLIAEAAAAMEGDDLRIQLSPADRQTLTETFIDEVRQRAAKPQLQIQFSAPLAAQDTGPVLLDAAGRQIWDNRLAARLTRLWPMLRRKVAVLAHLDDLVTPAEKQP